MEKEKNMENLIIFPDIERLKNKIKELRAELLVLLLERDELIFVECVNIENAYMLSLGSLEYKAYERECTYLRLKRKLEILQAKRNRQEKIIPVEIEKTLDTEFEEYQKELDKQIEKLNKALKWDGAPVLKEDDQKELKKLYRKIVKALHPDVNKNLSDAKKSLFLNAVEAYKNGDLNQLRIISELIDNNGELEFEEDNIKLLQEEAERLEKAVKEVRESILNIKSQYPYNLKELLNDKEKVEERKREILQIIKEYDEAILIYRKRIADMLGELYE